MKSIDCILYDKLNYIGFHNSLAVKDIYILLYIILNHYY